MNAEPRLLLPYQRAWVNDASRWKIWLASRQIGKSFAAACEVVHDCLARPASLWVVLSAGERQALEFMEKVRAWTRAFHLVLADECEERAGTVLKSAEVRYANGSRVLALPANPETARGYSANLVLDEFAFHQDSAAIWRAILPSVTNPLRGVLKVRVLSTPNGKGNAFHQLWTNAAEPVPANSDASVLVGGERMAPAAGAASGTWSRHRTTIHEAVAAGLAVDLEELRRQLNDPEGWAQEFECEFRDRGGVLLPYELIGPCESPEATEADPVAIRQGSSLTPALPTGVARRCLGVDLGRQHDLTVIWVLEPVGDVLWTRAVRVLDRQPFHQQLAVLTDECARARRVCVDATGMGAMLAEELARQFGAARIEQCSFTAPFKQELYTRLRRTFEDRLVRIPIARTIRDDLHGLEQQSDSSGQVRYVAARTAGGHCDRATALALAIRAASQPRGHGFARPFSWPLGAVWAGRHQRRLTG